MALCPPPWCLEQCMGLLEYYEYSYRRSQEEVERTRPESIKRLKEAKGIDFEEGDPLDYLTPHDAFGWAAEVSIMKELRTTIQFLKEWKMKFEAERKEKEKQALEASWRKHLTLPAIKAALGKALLRVGIVVKSAEPAKAPSNTTGSKATVV